MCKIYLINKEEMAGIAENGLGQRTRYIFQDKNNKGESLVVELSNVNLDSSLGKIWKQKGYISENIKDYIAVSTYVTEENGNCYGRYNPQHTKDHKVNFEWVLEDTNVNRNKILETIAKLAKIETR